jgi:hypothetical protein
MHRRRDVALRFSDQLALEDVLPDQHYWPRRAANMLLHRDVEQRRQRQRAQWRVGRRQLAVVRVYAPGRVVAENLLEDAHVLPRCRSVAC